MPTITLFCLAQCDNLNKKNIIKVKIERDKSVGKLKEEIKKKKHKDYINVRADELQLWKVDIPLNKPNERLDILNTQPYANIKEELGGEELDTTKNIVEYFSNELDEHINIIIQRERINVLLFGLTGHGKSSIANMLIQGGIHQENAFKINNGAMGETINILSSVNERFQVFDTIGLGESSSGSVPHKEAVKKIRDYFSKCQVPLNYICYVKKQGRFTKEDVKMFKLFKRVFKGGEINFTIIITHSKPEWIEENLEIIKKNFGNYPIVPVNFPWSNGDDSVVQFKERERSLERLLDVLLKPVNKGIKLEVLSSTQVFEKKISNVISVVPIVGTAYQLISSGVYYTLGKSNTAKSRLKDGVIGTYSDITLISTGLGGSVIKAFVKNVGMVIAAKAANQVKGKLGKKLR